MSIDLKAAEAVAQRYLRTSEPLEVLGWGIGGYVLLSPDARTAVKVHRSREGFERELLVYRKLRRLRITELHGLNIPQLRGHSTGNMLIRMDFVSAPFLLDFAGVLLSPPDFPEDVMAHWHAEIEERFHPNTDIVYAVYDSLAKHGLYYVDFRQTNLKLDGLPGLSPPDPIDPDESL
jgi:hypothetical protein